MKPRKPKTFGGNIKNCEGCRQDFEQKGSNHKFCSKDCRYLFRKDDDLKTIYEWNSRHPANQILKTARHRAKKRGLDFNIGLEDIILPDVCPVLGIPFKINRGSGRGGNNDSYSLDRIDPTMGYIKGNVQVISHQANSMKYNATPDLLLKFAEWVLNTYGK